MIAPPYPPLPVIADDLRSGRLRAQDLMEAAIAAHDRWDGPLQAYKTWDPDGARRGAAAADAAFAAGRDLGPLQGIPVAVKDLYGVAGLPTFAGSPRRLPAEWEREGPVIEALRDQLAVIAGKTHTVEFAYGALGNNSHWGTPRNPWDGATHRVPGGSSSGAGVSLCEGSALVALGTDTGGSVRIPASATGCVGLKTSVGRWSIDGIVPLSPTFDTAGVLARSVADAALAFAAIDPGGRRRPAPAAAEIGTFRLGVADDFFWDDAAPGIAETVRVALDELSAAGARLEPASLPEAVEAFALHVKGSLLSAELLAFLKDDLPDWVDTLDSGVAMRIADGAGIPAEEFLRRRRRFERLAAAASARFETVDALLSPTLLIPPPGVDELETRDGFRRAYMGAIHNTCPVNLLGLCALSLPAGLDALGLPVGLQIVMPHGKDARLVEVGLAVEAVLGAAPDRIGIPPLCRP